MIRPFIVVFNLCKFQLLKKTNKQTNIRWTHCSNTSASVLGQLQEKFFFTVRRGSLHSAKIRDFHGLISVAFMCRLSRLLPSKVERKAPIQRPWWGLFSGKNFYNSLYFPIICQVERKREPPSMVFIWWLCDFFLLLLERFVLWSNRCRVKSGFDTRRKLCQ